MLPCHLGPAISCCWSSVRRSMLQLSTSSCVFSRRHHPGAADAHQNAVGRVRRAADAVVCGAWAKGRSTTLLPRRATTPVAMVGPPPSIRSSILMLRSGIPSAGTGMCTLETTPCGTWIRCGCIHSRSRAATVALTSPPAGGSFFVAAGVLVTAAALDGDGAVTKVDFDVDGALIDTDTTSPYSTTWTPSVAVPVSERWACAVEKSSTEPLRARTGRSTSVPTQWGHHERGFSVSVANTGGTRAAPPAFGGGFLWA